MCQAADRLLGFSLTDVMFNGTADDLKQTKVTQPAVFLHSVVAQRLMTIETPNMVAGHSLGEFSALVACGALRFEDALLLVSARAQAMQAACEANPGTMAAVLGLPDEQVDELCKKQDGVVVAANFNCPGQVVISGEVDAIDAACVAMKEAGARRALRLPVGGAFHSPLMQPAAEALKEAILKGTGDVISAVIAGMSLNGYSFYDSVKKAASFVSKCIAYCEEYHVPDQWGLCFEMYLKDLME